MENDSGRFIECSSRNRAFFPRGKFTPLNDKIAGKVNSLRKNVGERHVYPAKPVFPRGKPSYPREEVAEKENEVYHSSCGIS